jgi:hypothetical protein
MDRWTLESSRWLVGKDGERPSSTLPGLGFLGKDGYLVWMDDFAGFVQFKLGISLFY